MSVDVAAAQFIAALLKTLEDADPDLKKRLAEHKQRLTPDDLLETLKIVKEFRHPDVPSDRILQEEIGLFLEYQQRQ